MQLRGLLCFCAFVFLALVPAAVAAPDHKNGCPITTSPDPLVVPPDPYPPYAAQGAFWYGTSGLWTQLEAEGVWRALPRRDKGYFNKVFLWQQGYDWRKEPQPELVVIQRRLDAHAPLVLSQGCTNGFVANGSAMITGVIFPTEGCWEITSYHDGHTLTFVVSVQP